MKIGIVGSRRRVTTNDRAMVIHAFDCISDSNPIIISGGCDKGADYWAETLARIRGIPITIYHAHWSKFGKAAGVIRNDFIAKDSDILIACVANDRTGGTEDTIRKFTKYHPEGKIIII